MFFQNNDSGNIYPRKKRRNPLVFVLLGLLGVLVVAYIIYAINLPEPQAFANITPEASGQTASSQPSAMAEPTGIAGVHFSLSDPSATPQTAAAPTQDLDLQPVSLVLTAFNDRWEYALQTMEELRPVKDLSYAFPAMDIAHGDMMRDMATLSALPVSDGAQSTESAWIHPLGTATDIYEFQMTDSDGRPLSGQVNTSTQAFYYEVKGPGDEIQRFFEMVQVEDITYAQLITSDGPYAGALYFSLSAGGDLRCAILTSQQLQSQSEGITRFYSTPPGSWEAFIGSAIPYFSALREEIVNIPMDGLGENSQSDTQGTEQAEPESSEGARIAASTPRPTTNTPAPVEEDNAEALANLPEEDGDDPSGVEEDISLPLEEEGSLD